MELRKMEKNSSIQQVSNNVI